MVWLYVPASEGWSSVYTPCCPPIAPSVTSRGKAFAPVSWRRGWQTGGYLTRLCGLTLPPSMAARGVASWMSSLQATRASHSALPGVEAARPTLATSGPTWPASSARSDQLSFFLRTCQGTCVSDCEPCEQTFSGWVTAFVRASSARQKSALRTCASGCSSSPQWPTPTVKGDYNKAGLSARSGDGLATAVARWPTPTAEDGAKGSPKQRYTSGSTGLTAAAAVGQPPGALNPAWVALLMGFPPDWTTPGEPAGRTASPE